MGIALGLGMARIVQHPPPPFDTLCHSLAPLCICFCHTLFCFSLGASLGLGTNHAYRARYQAFFFPGNTESRQLGRAVYRLVTTASLVGALCFNSWSGYATFCHVFFFPTGLLAELISSRWISFLFPITTIVMFH
jgi:hypothetical protein